MHINCATTVNDNEYFCQQQSVLVRWLFYFFYSIYSILVNATRQAKLNHVH